MMIRQALIENVEASYIETYLKQQGIKKDSDNSGQDTAYWINELFEKRLIDISKFQDFLFDELFWGKRKAIRIYKISNIRQIKFFEDWSRPLQEKYNIDTMDFIHILETQDIREDEKNIVAVKNTSNEKGELTNLKVLYCFGVRTSNHEVTTLSYVPVEIDFIHKIMILKIWNRNGLFEYDRSGDILNKTYSDLENTFNVKTQAISYRGKKALFNMSQSLIQDMYAKVPNYKRIEGLSEITKAYIQRIYKDLNLEHVEENNGELYLNKGVIDVEDEFRNELEKIVISDYFFNRSHDNIWEMGVESIISKIRFNDQEHVLTSMSGDNSERPIFCTKTFLALKKSLKDASVVERLWIETKRGGGKLKLKYDASSGDYLEILILSNIRFKEQDFDLAWEIYKKYE